MRYVKPEQRSESNEKRPDADEDQTHLAPHRKPPR
jgi:hypothetical protein